ncbi:MAG: Holliday junction ATP-dependent DNA helicase RuvA [Alphaproteobacteria bacterium ADurb.Bin438]|nr:MAG: Holliday junction ATP-dependent DNA helicase RuvA [Alphaproteobacteria bacterium ADurb.Bin438]
MIAYLKGIIAEINETTAIVEVGGVGYIFYASSKTLQALKKGEATVIHTEMVIREDSHTLYGFVNKKEQDCFKLLTTVQGVGPRVGIGILSSLSVDEINRAISTADSKLIGKANGVGPKLAARIITELKGKVESNLSVAVVSQNMAQSLNNDFENAISALINLGYFRSEAVMAVDKVASQNPEITLSKLIKLALKEMDKK